MKSSWRFVESLTKDSCVAGAFAMAASQGFYDFVSFVNSLSGICLGRERYTLEEGCEYLRSHNLKLKTKSIDDLGLGLREIHSVIKQREETDVTNNSDTFNFEPMKIEQLANRPAVLIVEVLGVSGNASHALYWDGDSLWDPAKVKKENPVNLSEYSLFVALEIAEIE